MSKRRHVIIQTLLALITLFLLRDGYKYSHWVSVILGGIFMGFYGAANYIEGNIQGKSKS